jgi:hypothetical protein
MIIHYFANFFSPRFIRISICKEDVSGDPGDADGDPVPPPLQLEPEAGVS